MPSGAEAALLSATRAILHLINSFIWRALSFPTALVVVASVHCSVAVMGVYSEFPSIVTPILHCARSILICHLSKEDSVSLSRVLN